MSTYDLTSLKLPKLYGKALTIFSALASNSLTQPLIIGSLLESGGINKLRAMQVSEAPTYLPLARVTEQATAGMPLTLNVPANERTEPGRLPFKTLRDYALAYRQGNLTPIEVAERVIQAIAESDCSSPPLRAFSAVLAQDVREQAEQSNERLRQGTARSILEGVPVAVKDEVDMAPYPTTVGTKFMGKQAVQHDSYVVSRLRAAGALLVGKTNMHEIGIAANGENIHHGRIANPYDLQRDPGGSSSGSGAAVGAGLVPAAIGADGGGSIRIPASHCGVVGLKPTFGRVSEAGAAPLCWSMGHLGPLGASVEDVALVYQVIAGPDPNDPHTHQQPPISLEGWNIPDLSKLSLGIFPAWFRHASQEVVEANEKMVSEFEKAGAQIVEISIPELDAMRVAHVVTILSEIYASMKNLAAPWGDFAPSSRLNLVLGEVMGAKDYIHAQRIRTRALQIFEQVYQKVDVVLTPTTGMTAPIVPDKALSHGWSDLSTETEMMRFVFPGNLCGLPAISFPVGYDSHGMPVGMQAMGRHWEEHLLLRVAYNAELRFDRRLPATHFDIL